jgi:hypothetical protein
MTKSSLSQPFINYSDEYRQEVRKGVNLIKEFREGDQ